MRKTAKLILVIVLLLAACAFLWARGSKEPEPMEEPAEKPAAAAPASKYQEVQQAIQQLTAEGDKYLGERRQMEQVRDQEALRGMVHYIGEKIPEWRDPALVKRERPGIESLFNAYGYSPQEIAMLRDPRALHMARDLMLAKSTQAKAGKAGEQIRQSPRKPLRGGSLRGKGGGKTNKLVARAKQTGKREDVTAAAKAILFGG